MPSVPAAWTPTRAATRRSWPSPSACAGAASTPRRAGRRPRSALCRCCRACWSSAAGPARGTPRGCPRPGPSPSTRSSSACPSAAPASCPGRHSDQRPWLSSPALGGSPPQTGQSGSLQRGPLLFMCIYWLFICPRGPRAGTEAPGLGGEERRWRPGPGRAASLGPAGSLCAGQAHLETRFTLSAKTAGLEGIILFN